MPVSWVPASGLFPKGKKTKNKTKIRVTPPTLCTISSRFYGITGRWTRSLYTRTSLRYPHLRGRPKEPEKKSRIPPPMDFRSRKVKPKTSSLFLFFAIMIYKYDCQKGRKARFIRDVYCIHLRERRKAHAIAYRQKHKICKG